MANITEKQREQGIYKVTIVGSIVNFLLLLLKLIAGIIGNSAAMIADAVHSLSDFFTDVVVLVFVRVSNKPKDKCHDYGHAKYETFATLVIGSVLLLVGLGIAWNGASVIISVIRGATLESPGMLALMAAVISIVSKEALYQYTVIYGRKLKSDAVIANAWHHRSDALSSIATAIGIGGAIFLGDKWTILDPLAALFVSYLIIKVALQLMKPCVDELMEKSLPDDVENEITLIVESFGEVSNLHNLHTRKIGNNYAIEFHIRMDGKTSLTQAHDKITEIEQRLKEQYGQKTHVIIHTEPQNNHTELKEISEFFNSRALIYEEKHLEHIGGMESKQIIPSFFPSHTKTMIDLGIGTGLELEGIFKRFPKIEVTGLDIAEDMLKALKEKYPDKNINLYCKSYFNHDFGNYLYDVALSVMTLHHYNHNKKTGLYRKIYNSIKPNGLYIECDFMLSEKEYENPQETENWYFSEFERLKKEQGINDDREYHYDTPCTVSNQKKMLLEAGFTSVKEVWQKNKIVILVAKKIK